MGWTFLILAGIFEVVGVTGINMILQKNQLNHS